MPKNRKDSLSLQEMLLALGLVLLLFLLGRRKDTSPTAQGQPAAIPLMRPVRKQKKQIWRGILVLTILTIVFSIAGYILVLPSSPFYSVPIQTHSDGPFYFIPSNHCDNAATSANGSGTDDITYTINIDLSAASSPNDLVVTIRPQIESRTNPKVSIACIGSYYIWPGDITPSAPMYEYTTDRDRVGTHLIPTNNTSPPISFIWHDGVQQIDMFRRRIFLRLANFVDVPFSSQYTY